MQEFKCLDFDNHNNDTMGLRLQSNDIIWGSSSKDQHFYLDKKVTRLLGSMYFVCPATGQDLFSKQTKVHTYIALDTPESCSKDQIVKLESQMLSTNRSQ